MKAEIKVLVTGAGSLLGEGIIRALRASSLKVRIVAADPSPLSAGLYWADAAHTIPMADAADYLARIEEILVLEKPEAVLVGTDVELSVFAAHRERLESEFSTSIIVSSPEVVAIADDKWKTYQFLRENGFDYPESCLPGGEKELVEKVGFPLVVKPRVGARSMGVHLVRDWNELRTAVEAGSNVIIQECVGTPESEYTAGALYFDGRCDASIVMRRQLRDGNTYRAFVEDYPQLNRLVRKWTEALKPYGPVNFQFRVAEGRAKVFEINGRFSGTTPLRAHAGFNEVEMTLKRVLRGEPVCQPAVRSITILRHWSETVIETKALLGSERIANVASGHLSDIAPARVDANLPAVARQGGEFRVLGTAQHEEWTAVLQRSVQHDFHHLPGYHRFAEQRGEGTAHLFTWREGEYVIALPLLLRQVDGEAPADWNDATSVYGYGGPVASHERMPEWVVRNFQAALRGALVERRVVSAFSRLHPLIAQHELLAGLGECRVHGQTVSIDLTQSLEAQWAQHRKTWRRCIAKLQRDGVVCIHDVEKRYFGEFISVYHETMRRVNAHDSYFFGDHYFHALAQELGSVLQLFVVHIGGRVAAAALFTICNGIVQAHLAGMRDEFRKLSPMRLLDDTARLWAHEKGARVLHFGGGVGAKEDSVFDYKAGFSNQRHDFTTWRWIVAPDIYRELCERRTRVNQQHGLEPVSADYFPAYRCATVSRAALAHAGGGRFSVLNTAQEEEWNSVLACVTQHDVYHLAEYHRLAEQRGEGTAQLFAYREGDYTIAFPLLLSPVGTGSGEEWSDATSVYGYAGPLASHADMPASVVRTFQEALNDALVERRVVAAFSRFHPLIPQSEMLTGLGECRPAGHTVSIDLTLPPEAQRAQYRSAFKTRINKLRRHGVVCLRDEDRRHLGDFVGIYHETMRRVSAHDSYFFDEDYFAGLASGLGPKLQLFVAKLGADVVAGALFTICDGIVQYHLGGTRAEFLRLSPTGLIFDTVRLWAQENGARVFHLGGGVGSKEDSLFCFKAGFSDRRHRFETWRWVITPEVYQGLCEERLRTNELNGLEATSADYFPAYRCPAAPRVVAVSEPMANAVSGTFPN